MTQKDLQFTQTPLFTYTCTDKLAWEGVNMQRNGRRVPTVRERFVLGSVSLGLLLLALFVGNLYFVSSSLPFKLVLFTVFLLFSGIIVLVNVLFNRRH